MGVQIRWLAAVILLTACGEKPQNARAPESAATADTFFEVKRASRGLVDSIGALHRGRWLKQAEKSEMDDGTILAFWVPTVAFSGSEFERPTLFMRCIQGKTEFVFESGVVAGTDGRSSVRVRFDRNAPERQAWLETTDHRFIVPPNPIAFLRRIRNVDTLRIEYSPFSGGARVATYAIQGADSAAREIAALCKWSL